MAELPVKAAAKNLVIAMARLPPIAAKIAFFDDADAIIFLPTLGFTRRLGGIYQRTN